MKPGKISVTVIGPGDLMPVPGPGIAVLVLGAGFGHGHADDAYCPACAAQGDIRALLFDLDEAVRQGSRPAFGGVLIDARAGGDVGTVMAALEGRLPARALRDHQVARRFRVAE